MQTQTNNKRTVVVGMSTCNIAAGAQEVYDLCRKTVEEKKLADAFGLSIKEMLAAPDPAKLATLLDHLPRRK